MTLTKCRAIVRTHSKSFIRTLSPSSHLRAFHFRGTIVNLSFPLPRNRERGRGIVSRVWRDPSFPPPPFRREKSGTQATLRMSRRSCRFRDPGDVWVTCEIVNDRTLLTRSRGHYGPHRARRYRILTLAKPACVSARLHLIISNAR